MRRTSWILGGLTAASILVLIAVLPSPYDESLYRNFSKAFAQTGRPFIPELPNGYLLLFHPYLIVLLQAGWIRLGFDSLLFLRILHFSLWVVPTIWLTWRIAVDFFNDKRAGVGALAFLSTLAFLHVEACTAEMDLPYTAATLLIVWLTWRWHMSVRNGTVFGWDWGYLTMALSVSSWIKLQSAIPAFAAAALTLVVLVPHAKGLRTKVLGALALMAGIELIVFSFWILWADSLGGDIIKTFSFLTSGLQGENPHYDSPTGSYGWLRYFLFSAAYIGVPIFCAAALGLVKTVRVSVARYALPYLVVPFLLIVLTLLASKIRVVRYWDPALPLLCVLGGALFTHAPDVFARPLRTMFVACVSFLSICLVFLKNSLFPQFHIFAFSVDAHQLLAMLLVLVGGIGVSLKWRPDVCVALLLAASLGTGLGELQHAFSLPDPRVYDLPALTNFVQSNCEKERQFGLYKMQLAYGLICPFYTIETATQFKSEYLEDIDTWILPKDLSVLHNTNLTSIFIPRLKSAFCVSPKSREFPYHEIWVKREK